ncbi:MAG: class I SAM-dependent methyltransferase [Candidatus Sulfotelmatobacter sp.]
MSTPTLEFVQAYYDERVEGKIRDFAQANPRIEAAIQLIADWAPPNPRKILEIGCGIGATSWRMARAWSQAEVIGADVSSTSIEVARKCFQLPNLSYRHGLIKEGVLVGTFDLVLLMDTYEHIPLEDRTSIHAAIRSLLSEEARLVLTFPTPTLQNYIRDRTPSDLQPIDEDVAIQDIVRLAEETGTRLLFYREVGIWHYGDYAHVVLGRSQSMAEVALREYKPDGIAGLKQRIKRLLRRGEVPGTSLRDYLGSDVLRPRPRNVGGQFKVTTRERHRLASSWRSRGKID